MLAAHPPHRCKPVENITPQSKPLVQRVPVEALCWDPAGPVWDQLPGILPRRIGPNHGPKSAFMLHLGTIGTPLGITGSFLGTIGTSFARNIAF